MKYKAARGIVNTQSCGRYYLVTPEETVEISETAGICLKYLRQGADIRELCDYLEDMYEIEDREILESDVRSLISDLLGRRIITRYNGD